MALTVAAALPATATSTPPTTECKLTLTKSVDNPTPAPGGEVTFTITITATGCVGKFVSIHDDLFPTSLTLVSASPAPSKLDPKHLRWFLTGDGVVPGQKTDTLTARPIPDEPNPTIGTTHIVASVPAAAACDTAIVNTATASSFTGKDEGTDQVAASSGVDVPKTRHNPPASGARTVTPTCPTVTPPPSSST